MSTIGLRRVSVSLGETNVLREISLDLDARTIAIVGENGSGKSTFARLIGGLIKPNGGDIRILGFDPQRQADELRRRIALVFSNPDAQIVMPTVAEDVAFSLRTERLETDETDRRVSEALKHFELSALAERPSHDLSGGQKQLLALCGAFVRRPQLVIADEPTAYLDARNSRRVSDHLFAPAGHRLILVTHDLSLAQRCERAVLFARGHVAAVGEPADVIARYEESLIC
ncbi:ABC transporter ATP-binding protein [Lysinibacter sp. HNR]|uniref:energy-coupling factor ABC transporter ATP-binding protein n=1 Tax=Lysinibacter sp. HNR TaxID=3031408 RepID=UPI002434FB65|nr:ABC transporter ATP-binding protein [Lysinibacter sp. HNR]WGD36879.1 ABC transporter ATP-binding protein [Lysinibacter sp. HNR]